MSWLTGDSVERVEADDLEGERVAPDHAADQRIADRLHALEAEKVIQRALEIEAETADEPHMITTAQLERIAEEIGIDPAFVHQALGEKRLQPTERTRFQRWVLPEDLIEVDTITGLTRDEVDSAIDKWMTAHEGLTKGRVLGDGVDWDVDRRWKARARANSRSGGNRISRVAGGDIEHRVHSLSDDEHTVALSSKGKGPLMVARAAIGLTGAWGGVLLTGSILSDQFFLGLGISAILVAVGTGLGVAGARWWARGIRGALRRSLTGLVGAAKPKSKGWLSRLRRRGDSV